MLLNNTALKILEEFCSGYNKRIYGRQIADKLKLNQKTVSNVLIGLEKESILKYSTEGRNKYYYLNLLNPQIEDIIKIVEIARKNKFLQKYLKLRGFFNALEKRTKDAILIFGSYANFTSNKDSDLDVFVIGNIENTNDLEELYKIKINVVKSNKEKFNKNDVFIKEIIKNHIILKGVEEFIGLIWQH